jgi:sugar/nucleoside kinase (ribokinase family)
MCTDLLIKPIDSLPEKGKLLPIESVHMKTGGCAMNASIGLSILGIKTAFVGKTGGDAFGNFMRDTLTEHGVNTDGLVRDENAMSSMSVVAISADGERSILHYYGTNAALCYEDIDTSVLLEAQSLFIGGTFLTPTFAGKDAAKALELAQNNGILTFMDTAWDASGKWLDTIKCSLRYLDWFMPSIEEAEQMVGTREPGKISAAFKKMGVKNAALKMGADGCYIEPENTEGFFVKPYPVECVDSAGAGDAWCARFIAGIMKGFDTEKAAELGNGTGALCVTSIGTTSGLRNMADTLDFMQNCNGLTPPGYRTCRTHIRGQ